MAKRSFSAATFTPAVSADNAVLAGGWMAITNGGSTSMLNVMEIYMGGQAGASSPSIMVFARDSTVGATITALASPNSDGPLNSFTAALATPAVTFIASTTVPIRSNQTTAAKLNLSFNAFGGIVRWVAAPYEEWQIVGVAVNVSESSLSAFTGGTPGLMGAHIIYEPY